MAFSSIHPERIPVEALFALTLSNFEPRSFRQFCQEIAPFDSKNSDDDLWNFELEPDYPLVVSLYRQSTESECENRQTSETPGVSCAVLSTCWWDTWNKDEHQPDSFKTERAQYDSYFDEFYKTTLNALGTPMLRGRDTTCDANQYAIWRGRNALLILQQSAFDLQFGYDINYWIQPWRGADPAPPNQIPFIQWLQAFTALPPLFELPQGWHACGPGLEGELQREIQFNPKHPLHGIKAMSAARSNSTDDVLFQLFNFKAPLAEVHLTWSVERRPDWPDCQFYSSWQEWRSSRNEND
jgi:hypothetical protein